MVGSVLFDGFLHETGKGGEDVDGRVDLLVVELSVNEDLSLCDVSGKVGDGVGDVVVLRSSDGYGHGEDGDLGDGSVFAVDSACSFVDCGEIGIEITGV